MSIEAKIALGVAATVLVAGVGFFVLYQLKGNTIKSAGTKAQPTHIYK